MDSSGIALRNLRAVVIIIVLAFHSILPYLASPSASLARAAGCLCLLAIRLRFTHERCRALDSLSANAYRIDLIHCVFAVWLQYALLDVALSAIGKAAMVFGGTMIMSWAIAARAMPLVSLLDAGSGKRAAPEQGEIGVR